ncbi:chitooligosaccharidolytic beta-N-acetylglucosaminidase-like [Oratosquilla oratoria]|uniref:chitooligosaccharidolytic beta-N-acetylglucosaminidase-like n=1 Tax=Oratosquilla oratoria TaxID=337810 RepID=UPI003F773C18
MKSLLVLMCLVAVVLAQQNYFKLPAPYSYQCNQGKCSRLDRSEATEYQTLSTCKLTCGEFGSIWPQPTGQVELSTKVVPFMPRNIEINKMSTSNEKVAQLMRDATRLFERSLHHMHPEYTLEEKRINLQSEQRPYDGTVQIERSNFYNFNQESDRYNQRSRYDLQYSRRPTLQEFANKNSEFQFRRIEDEEFYRNSPLNADVDSSVDRQQVNLEITITSPEDRLKLDTDESYNLVVQTQGKRTTVTILAQTFFGARHALETLSQLVSYDEIHNSLQMVSDATVTDKPAFVYRGVMLDTGRNYYSKDSILRLLDAMSYNKLNTLHWHISDSASFPLYTRRVPEMAYYGAYDASKVYYPEQVREIVQYAKVRGIRVVPELNAPGRTSNGWQWGAKEGKGDLALCANKEPWFDFAKEVPAGQINPVNPEVYSVLGEIYRDMFDMFEDDMFHMGGDSVSFKCWSNSDAINQYLTQNNREPGSREYFELWNTFQKNALAKLEEAAKGRSITPIIHSSSFARNYVNKDKYVIQLSENAHQDSIADYVSNNYHVIFSNHDQWNVDCGNSNWMGEKVDQCGPNPVTWQSMYNTSPLDMLVNLGVTSAREESQGPITNAEGQSTKHPKDLVLGGTATMYSYETDQNNIESRLWPKLSGFAERLWTDPNSDAELAEFRLYNHRERLVERGVRAQAVRPAYCLQNEDSCYTEAQYRRFRDVQTVA